MNRRSLFSTIACAAVAAMLAMPASGQVITLHGAVQFNDEHPFTQGLLKFQELVRHPSIEGFGVTTVAIQIGKELWLGSVRGDRIAIFPLLTR